MSWTFTVSTLTFSPNETGGLNTKKRTYYLDSVLNTDEWGFEPKGRKTPLSLSLLFTEFWWVDPYTSTLGLELEERVNQSDPT